MLWSVERRSTTGSHSSSGCWKGGCILPSFCRCSDFIFCTSLRIESSLWQTTLVWPTAEPSFSWLSWSSGLWPFWYFFVMEEKKSLSNFLPFSSLFVHTSYIKSLKCTLPWTVHPLFVPCSLPVKVAFCVCKISVGEKKVYRIFFQLLLLTGHSVGLSSFTPHESCFCLNS